MGKNPAILWYPNDYLGGTMGMTFEEKGAYVELLMLQFNRGHMTTDMIGHTVGRIWDNIKEKFTQDENGLWYNVRLEEEFHKRQKYVESRNNNRSGKNQHPKPDKSRGHMAGHMTSHMNGHTVGHMENENEYININGLDNSKREEETKKSSNTIEKKIILDNDINKKEKVSEKKEKKPAAEKKPAQSKPNFIDQVMELFQDAYKDVRNEAYILSNKNQERSAAGKIVAWYKERRPDIDAETTKQDLKLFFIRACDIDDPWLYTNMSMSILYSKINQVVTIIKNGNKSKKNSNNGTSNKASNISDEFRQGLINRILTSKPDTPVPSN